MQSISSNAWGQPAEPVTVHAGARRWSLHAVASAVVLATSLTTSSAWALALGRVSVQSSLGQPLRAEIDLPSISDAEAASLQVGVAAPDTFRAAGMEFNPMLSEVRFILERRPNGRTVLRLTSDRTVTEPFLDVVVDVNWANGHLVRGYTMLFDPPNLKTPAPVLPAAAASPTPTSQTSPAVAAPVASESAPATKPTKTASAEAAQVKVRPGDTAGRLAAANKPANATLEQMLVSLLRANPHAFIGSNINRMRAGVVLDMPSEAAATEVPAAEARRLIAVQSKDFNEYRRRLAAAAPAQDKQEANRSATGTVQAEVQEQAAAAPTPDKLTLSKGSVKAADSAEAKIASDRQKTESTTRQGELNRNLDDLKKLEAATSSAAPEPAPTPVPAVTPDKPEPGPAVESSLPPVPAEKPATPPAPAPTPTPTAAPQAEQGGDLVGFAQSLLSHPLALPVGGGVAGLLALLAGWRVLRRRKADIPELEADESILEAGGGQSVDTDDAQAGPVSSMMYSPSQLDAGGDVDPIAEADVYLAYGRDKQAEEILMEALRLHPDRLNVRNKLLEIYAQRRDLTAFAGIATEVFQMTEGQGDDWEQARSLGHSIDPSNPLYQPSTLANAPLTSSDIDLDLTADEPAPPAETPAAPEPVQLPNFPDLDLSLDVAPPTAEPATEATSTPASPEDHSLDFDLDLSEVAPAAEPAPAPASDDFNLDFDLDLSTEAPAVAAEPPAASMLPPEVQDLSLDLDTPAEPAVETPAEPDFDMLSNLEVDEGGGSGDPLETKLSLAREFEAIGDTEGARSLAEEVVNEATGDLQAQARAFLSQLP